MISYLINYFKSIFNRKKISNEKYVKVYWKPYNCKNIKKYYYLNEYQAGMWNCEVDL